jgi:acetyltransferase
VDHHDHLALLGEVKTGSGPRQVAEARWVRRADEPDHADFAIAIADDYQRSGLGNSLLDMLQRSAAARGIGRLCGCVLRNNLRMSGWLEARGWHVESDLDDPGALCVGLSLRSVEPREWRAAA